MSNPLFNALGSNGNNQIAGLINQFNIFKNRFQGDPRAQVQQMLNSGQISQDQYNQAVKMANALQSMIKL